MSSLKRVFELTGFLATPKRHKQTALADKYTHPTGPEHAALAGIIPLKSGLTPLTKGGNLTDQQLQEQKALEVYQRHRFHGFTTSELQNAESLAPLITETACWNLGTVTIHPIYKKENWQSPLPRHKANYPVRNYGSGYWEVDNPEVWTVLKPALQLATLFLDNSQASTWLDALFAGSLTKIEDHELPIQFRRRKDVAFTRLRAQPFEERNTEQARQSLQEGLLQAADDIEFIFHSGYVGVNEFEYAITSNTNYSASGKVRMEIAFEMLQPLLRPDLTAAERMLDTFRFAVTLVHETTHAIGFLKRQAYRNWLTTEPYFEDERLSELGYSWEKSVSGGINVEFIDPTHDLPERGLPTAGIFQISWPSAFHATYSSDPVLEPQPEDWWFFTYYPIACRFFMDLQTLEFWSVSVANTQMPRAVGFRIFGEMGDHGEAQQSMKIPQMLIAVANIDFSQEIIAPSSLSHEERQIVEAENQRRQRSVRIKSKFMWAGLPDTNNVPKITGPLDRSAVTYYPPPKIARNQCHRFSWIRDYLFKNRLLLALDTMNFRMPEHIMLAHILHHGGIDLRPDEWRNFLIICHQRKMLFDYNTQDPPSIRRISEGWPAPKPTLKPTIQGPAWESLSSIPWSTIETLFKNLTKNAILNYLCFSGDYLDHDFEDFRWMINESFQNLFGYQRVLGPTSFSSEEFGAVIERSKTFTWGPDGVVRMVVEDKSSDENSSKAFSTPRKREKIRHRCHPS